MARGWRRLPQIPFFYAYDEKKYFFSSSFLQIPHGPLHFLSEKRAHQIVLTDPDRSIFLMALQKMLDSSTSIMEVFNQVH